MIPVASGVWVWLATGHTDMRKDFDGLALIAEATLKRDPHSCHLIVFRGRRGNLIKILWPSTADGTVTITAGQLGYLPEGIDWRMPQKTWQPTAEG